MADRTEETNKRVSKISRQPVKPGQSLQANIQAQNEIAGINSQLRNDLEIEKAYARANQKNNQTIQQAAGVLANSGGHSQVRVAPVQRQAAGMNAQTKQILSKYGVNPAAKPVHKTVSTSSQKSKTVGAMTTNVRNETITNNNSTTRNEIKIIQPQIPIAQPQIPMRGAAADPANAKLKVWLSGVFAKQQTEAEVQKKEFRRREWSLQRSAAKMMSRIQETSKTFAEKMNPNNMGASLGNQLKTIFVPMIFWLLAKYWKPIMGFLEDIEYGFRSLFGLPINETLKKNASGKDIFSRFRKLLGLKENDENTSFFSQMRKLMTDSVNQLIDHLKLFWQDRVDAVKSVDFPTINAGSGIDFGPLTGIIQPILTGFGETMRSGVGYLGDILGALVGGSKGALNASKRQVRQQAFKDLKDLSHGEYLGQSNFDRLSGRLKTDENSSYMMSRTISQAGRAENGKLNVGAISSGMQELQHSVDSGGSITVGPEFFSALGLDPSRLLATGHIRSKRMKLIQVPKDGDDMEYVTSDWGNTGGSWGEKIGAVAGTGLGIWGKVGKTIKAGEAISRGARLKSVASGFFKGGIGGWLGEKIGYGVGAALGGAFGDKYKTKLVPIDSQEPSVGGPAQPVTVYEIDKNGFNKIKADLKVENFSLDDPEFMRLMKKRTQVMASRNGVTGSLDLDNAQGLHNLSDNTLRYQRYESKINDLYSDNNEKYGQINRARHNFTNAISYYGEKTWNGIKEAGGYAGQYASNLINRNERLTNKSQIARCNYLMKKLMENGLTKEQAAGIAGNIMKESGFKSSTKIKDNNGKFAGGLVGWNGENLDRIERYFGKDIREISYQDQVDYLIKELKGEIPGGIKAIDRDGYASRYGGRTGSNVWDIISKCTNAQDAAICFERIFEGSGDYKGYTVGGKRVAGDRDVKRVEYAFSALNSFSGGADIRMEDMNETTFAPQTPLYNNPVSLNGASWGSFFDSNSGSTSFSQTIPMASPSGSGPSLKTSYSSSTGNISSAISGSFNNLEETIDIYWLGDSQTCTGLPKEITALGVKMKYFGRESANASHYLGATETGLGRINTNFVPVPEGCSKAYSATYSAKPGYCIIALGHNGNTKLKELIESLRGIGIKVILIKMWAIDGSKNKMSILDSEAMKKMYSGINADGWIDLTSLDLLNSGYLRDGVHLNESGAKFVAGVIVKQLKGQKVDLLAGSNITNANLVSSGIPGTPAPINNTSSSGGIINGAMEFATGAFNSMSSAASGLISSFASGFNAPATGDLGRVIAASKTGVFFSNKLGWTNIGQGTAGMRGRCTSGPETFYRRGIGLELAGYWWNTKNPHTATATNIYQKGFQCVWHGHANEGKTTEALNKNGIQPLPGDIMINFGIRRDGQPSGHAQMWNGEQWVSDSYQGSLCFVYPRERLGDASAQLWRLTGLAETGFGDSPEGKQASAEIESAKLANLQKLAYGAKRDEHGFGNYVSHTGADGSEYRLYLNNTAVGGRLTASNIESVLRVDADGRERVIKDDAERDKIIGKTIAGSIEDLIKLKRGTAQLLKDSNGKVLEILVAEYHKYDFKNLTKKGQNIFDKYGKIPFRAILDNDYNLNSVTTIEVPGIVFGMGELVLATTTRDKHAATYGGANGDRIQTLSKWLYREDGFELQGSKNRTNWNPIWAVVGVNEFPEDFHDKLQKIQSMFTSGSVEKHKNNMRSYTSSVGTVYYGQGSEFSNDTIAQIQEGINVDKKNHDTLAAEVSKDRRKAVLNYFGVKSFKDLESVYAKNPDQFWISGGIIYDKQTQTPIGKVEEGKDGKRTFKALSGNELEKALTYASENHTFLEEQMDSTLGINQSKYIRGTYERVIRESESKDFSKEADYAEFQKNFDVSQLMTNRKGSSAYKKDEIVDPKAIRLTAPEGGTDKFVDAIIDAKTGKLTKVGFTVKTETDTPRYKTFSISDPKKIYEAAFAQFFGKTATKYDAERIEKAMASFSNNLSVQQDHYDGASEKGLSSELVGAELARMLRLNRKTINHGYAFTHDPELARKVAALQENFNVNDTDNYSVNEDTGEVYTQDGSLVLGKVTETGFEKYSMSQIDSKNSIGNDQAAEDVLKSRFGAWKDENGQWWISRGSMDYPVNLTQNLKKMLIHNPGEITAKDLFKSNEYMSGRGSMAFAGKKRGSDKIDYYTRTGLDDISASDLDQTMNSFIDSSSNYSEYIQKVGDYQYQNLSGKSRQKVDQYVETRLADLQKKFFERMDLAFSSSGAIYTQEIDKEERRRELAKIALGEFRLVDSRKDLTKEEKDATKAQILNSLQGRTDTILSDEDFKSVGGENYTLGHIKNTERIATGKLSKEDHQKFRQNAFRWAKNGGELDKDTLAYITRYYGGKDEFKKRYKIAEKKYGEQYENAWKKGGTDFNRTLRGIEVKAATDSQEAVSTSVVAAKGGSGKDDKKSTVKGKGTPVKGKKDSLTGKTAEDVKNSNLQIQSNTEEAKDVAKKQLAIAKNDQKAEQLTLQSLDQLTRVQVQSAETLHRDLSQLHQASVSEEGVVNPNFGGFNIITKKYGNSYQFAKDV